MGPFGFLAVACVVLAIPICIMEKASRALLAKQEATGHLPHAYAGVAGLLNAYLAARYHVL